MALSEFPPLKNKTSDPALAAALDPVLDPDGLAFEIPPELEASAPPESRGLARDEVRLMVSYRSDNRVAHTRFRALGSFLADGDVLVINTSGTLNAALNAFRSDGAPVELRLSTHLPADVHANVVRQAGRAPMPGSNGGVSHGEASHGAASADRFCVHTPGDVWTVELRTPGSKGAQPFYAATPGETLGLPAGATATLHAPYVRDRVAASASPARLWIAALRLPCALQDYLARYGFPIRYGYVTQFWPIRYYQTVYATEPGSAEMPSAGRAFTPELITELVARGVQVVPLILHAGVASLESHEPPYAEYYRVPPGTARTVDAARAAGSRIVAVGTTVVRALETVTDAEGTTYPGEGWTPVVITPERGVRAVDALLTGLHEPRASHLAMIEALAGREHLRIAYAEALRERYLWHEFGDLHLILP